MGRTRVGPGGGDGSGGGGAHWGAVLEQGNDASKGIFIGDTEGDPSWHLRARERQLEEQAVRSKLTFHGQGDGNRLEINIPDFTGGSAQLGPPDAVDGLVGSPEWLNRNGRVFLELLAPPAAAIPASVDVEDMTIQSSDAGVGGNSRRASVRTGNAGTPERINRDAGDVRITNVNPGGRAEGIEATHSDGTDPQNFAITLYPPRRGAGSNGVEVGVVADGRGATADINGVTVGNAIVTDMIRITWPRGAAGNGWVVSTYAPRTTGGTAASATGPAGYSPGITFTFHEVGTGGNNFEVRFAYAATQGANSATATYTSATRLQVNCNGLCSSSVIRNAVNAARYTGGGGSEQLVTASGGSGNVRFSNLYTANSLALGGGAAGGTEAVGTATLNVSAKTLGIAVGGLSDLTTRPEMIGYINAVSGFPGTAAANAGNDNGLIVQGDVFDTSAGGRDGGASGTVTWAGTGGSAGVGRLEIATDGTLTVQAAEAAIEASSYPENPYNTNQGVSGGYTGKAQVSNSNLNAYIVTIQEQVMAGGVDAVAAVARTPLAVTHAAGVIIALDIRGVVPNVDTIAQVRAVYAAYLAANSGTQVRRFNILGTDGDYAISTGAADSTIANDVALTGGTAAEARENMVVFTGQDPDDIGDLLDMVTEVGSGTDGRGLEIQIRASSTGGDTNASLNEIRARFLGAGVAEWDPDRDGPGQGGWVFGGDTPTIRSADMTIFGNGAAAFDFARRSVSTRLTGGANYIPPSPIEFLRRDEDEADGKNVEVRYHHDHDTLQEILDAGIAAGISQLVLVDIYGTDLTEAPEEPPQTKPFYPEGGSSEEQGLSTVSSDATLTGTGATDDPLAVANPFTAADETKLDAALTAVAHDTTITGDGGTTPISVAAAVRYGDEKVRDTVASFILAGAGITVEHDDGNDTLTITNTAGADGGGSEGRAVTNLATRSQGSALNANANTAINITWSSSNNRKRANQYDELLLRIETGSSSTPDYAYALIPNANELAAGRDTEAIVSDIPGISFSRFYFTYNPSTEAHRVTINITSTAAVTAGNGPRFTIFGIDYSAGGSSSYTLPQATEAALGGVRKATTSERTATSGNAPRGWSVAGIIARITSTVGTLLSNADPQAPGTAAAGTGTSLARDDHVHAKELADDTITPAMLDADDATKKAAFRTRIGAGTGSGSDTDLSGVIGSIDALGNLTRDLSLPTSTVPGDWEDVTDATVAAVGFTENRDADPSTLTYGVTRPPAGTGAGYLYIRVPIAENPDRYRAIITFLDSADHEPVGAGGNNSIRVTSTDTTYAYYQPLHADDYNLSSNFVASARVQRLGDDHVDQTTYGGHLNPTRVEEAIATEIARIAALEALVRDGSLIREEADGNTGSTLTEQTIAGITIANDANVGYAITVGTTTVFTVGTALYAARSGSPVTVDDVNFYTDGSGGLLYTQGTGGKTFSIWTVRDVRAITAAINAAGGGGGGGVTVEDEGTALATIASTLNFTGAGVTVTGTGAEKTIAIPGGGGAAENIPPETATGTGTVTLEATDGAWQDHAVDTTATVAGTIITARDAATVTLAAGRYAVEVEATIAMSAAPDGNWPSAQPGLRPASGDPFIGNSWFGRGGGVESIDTTFTIYVDLAAATALTPAWRVTKTQNQGDSSITAATWTVRPIGGLKGDKGDTGGITTVNHDPTLTGDGDRAPLGVVNPFTDADETKLDGIASGANLYVLPLATESARGGGEAISNTEAQAASGTVPFLWSKNRFITAAQGLFATWARLGNTATIPAAKLPAATETAQGAVEAANSAESTDTTGSLIRAWTAARIVSLVQTLWSLVPVAEAEAGTAATLRIWSAQRVRQAINAAIRAGIATWARIGNTSLIPAAKLGSGTASATTFLAGDQTYKTPPTDPNAITGVTLAGQIQTFTRESGSNPVQVTLPGAAEAPLPGRAERIAFGAIASGTSETELTPVSTNPISVVYGSGQAEMISGISGNDFTLQPAIYRVTFDGTFAATNNNSAIIFALRQASDDSVIAVSEFVDMHDSTNRATASLMLWLRQATAVNLHITRPGQQASAIAANGTLTFTRLGTSSEAPSTHPSITQFDLTSGDQSPVAGTNIGGDTYGYELAIAQAGHVSTARIVGYAGARGSTRPGSVAVLKTLTADEYHHSTGTVDIPAGVTLAAAGDIYSIELQVFETGQTPASDDPISYHTDRITAHAVTAANYRIGYIEYDASETTAAATAANILDSGTFQVSSQTLPTRITFAIDSADTDEYQYFLLAIKTGPQPAGFTSAGLPADPAFYDPVDVVDGSTTYSAYIVVPSERVAIADNGDFFGVTAP